MGAVEGNHMRAWILRFALALVAWSLAGAAAGQYPTHAIRLIVGIPPGGAPDIAARVVGEKLGALLGQPVVVENHAGSNGNIAGDMVAKAPPTATRCASARTASWPSTRICTGRCLSTP